MQLEKIWCKQVSGQQKKMLKRIENKNSISPKLKRRVVSQGPCCVLIATPHANQKEQNIQDKSFVKKKSIRKLPQNLPSAIFVCTPWKIKNAKSWSFVSDDFFQFSVMFSFKMLIFRGGVTMMIWILTNFHHWLLLPLGKITWSTLNPTFRQTPDSRHYHQVLTLPMHGPNLGWQNLRLGQLGPKNTQKMQLQGSCNWVSSTKKL